MRAKTWNKPRRSWWNILRTMPPSVSLFDEFCCGHTSLKDAECSGSRIRSLGRKIGKINDWLLNKRRLKIREIANTKGIHTEKWLRFWIFTLVIVIYSQNGCLFSSEVTRKPLCDNFWGCLELINCNPEEIWRSLGIVDETGIHTDPAAVETVWV